MAGKITVVGSYNTGFVVHVDRMPVEGETLRGYRFRIEHGGKGSNQAIQSARLHCQTSIVAKIGTDIFGDRAVNKWKTENVDVSHVVRDSESPTGVGLVIVGPNGRNMIVVDLGANMRLSSRDVAAAEDTIKRSDVVLAQLEIPVETALDALRRSESVKVLNPAPATEIPPEKLESIDIITPNEVEMRVMAGLPADSVADLVKLAEKYVKFVGNVVVTLGEKGALIVGKSRVVHVKTPRVDAVDSTGAGDAFNGALAAALSRGFDLVDAVEYACCAGAFLTARIKGGELVEALPNEKELEKFISEHGDSC
ncbi:MAG: ribokinase [Candidatus Caldarchaeum sp.]|nr:ribokinase [Candidatus Caldarchaeum sp.]